MNNSVIQYYQCNPMYPYLFMLYKHGFCWARHKPVMVWLEFHIPTNDPGDCVNSTLLLLQGPLMRPTNPRPFFGLSLVLSLDHVAISNPLQLAPHTNQTKAMSVGSHRLRCQHHLDKQKQGQKRRGRGTSLESTWCTKCCKYDANERFHH